MSQYHEMPEQISEKDKNMLRALVSLKEEIEAIDWYHQRTAASADGELDEILRHNKLEEMEHAAMLLEWLRRNMDGWDDALRTYLMTERPILEIEEQAESGESAKLNGDLGIGSLKKVPTK